MIVDRDVAMSARDGVTLRADVYRPDAPGRHPVLLGALVGLGAGLAFTAGTGCAHSSDYTCGEFSLWFGGLGAGIGAGVGGIVALVRR